MSPQTMSPSTSAEPQIMNITPLKKREKHIDQKILEVQQVGLVTMTHNELLSTAETFRNECIIYMTKYKRFGNELTRIREERNLLREKYHSHKEDRFKLEKERELFVERLSECKTMRLNHEAAEAAWQKERERMCEHEKDLEAEFKVQRLLFETRIKKLESELSEAEEKLAAAEKTAEALKNQTVPKIPVDRVGTPPANKTPQSQSKDGTEQNGNSANRDIKPLMPKFNDTEEMSGHQGPSRESPALNRTLWQEKPPSFQSSFDDRGRSNLHQHQLLAAMDGRDRAHPDSPYFRHSGGYSRMPSPKFTGHPYMGGHPPAPHYNGPPQYVGTSRVLPFPGRHPREFGSYDDHPPYKRPHW